MTKEEIQSSFDQSPYIAFCGMKVEEADQEKQQVTVSLRMRPELQRRAGSGQFHGGPIASLIDTAGDFAIGISLGGGVPTINLRIDYLRPATCETLVAIAKVRRAGRTIAVVDIDVLDDHHQLVAIGRGTYSCQRG
jgi:uncharacterized protein (TIGR00369 family)